MHPVIVDTVTTSFLSRRPLLLLQKVQLSFRFVCLAVSSSSITSKGGEHLPPELWHRILDIVRESLPYEPGHPKLVRPVEMVDGLHGARALRCVELHDYTISQNFGDLIGDKPQTQIVDDYFYSPDNGLAEVSLDKILKLNELNLLIRSTGKYYDIMLDVTFAQQWKIPACLFDGIGVPEIISFYGGGKCWVCNEERAICPPSTVAKARKFDASINRGTGLACPLCLGMDFMRRDKESCQLWFDQFDQHGYVLGEQWTERIKVFEQRWDELGYQYR